MIILNSTTTGAEKMSSGFLNYSFFRYLIPFSRGSCLIRVQSVLYKVRLEQIKSANSQIVLKGM